MEQNNIDIELFKRECSSRLSQIFFHLFPNGRIRGKEFIVGDLDGSPGDSVSFNLDSSKLGVGGEFNSLGGHKMFSDFIEVWRYKKNVAFGPEFLEGSVVCVIEKDGKKSLIPFIDKLISEPGNEVARQLFEAEQRSHHRTLVFRPRSFLTSFIEFQDQKLSRELLDSISNPYKFWLKAQE